MAYVNTGYQGWKILQEIYLDDQSLTGNIMPNIPQISQQAIVPSTATITYNYPSDVAPTGGANGDVWYNPVANQLFKKIAGSWTMLLDRVTNDAYIAPVINETSCPV
jgi:hypothetical protein